MITLLPEIEGPPAEEARKRGTTPELLAVDSLRQIFVTLFDFLAGYIGTVNGTVEALSENCGQRFAQGLIEK
jgi:hypothetical protein